MRNRYGNALWVAIALVGLAAAAMQVNPKVPADKRLTMLRMQIVSAAKTVEQAKVSGACTEAQYTAARVQILEAAKCYNDVLDRFKRYDQIARTDEQHIAALLAAAIMTVKR